MENCFDLSYVNKSLQGKMPVRKPRFYITYGPQASGKGSIMKKVALKDGLDINNIVSVNVDDIVKSSPYYQKEMKKDLTKAEKQNLYWNVRKSGADDLSDNLLNTALLNRYDISWETTGEKIAWTVREINRIRKYDYEIVIVYPFVPVYGIKKGKLVKKSMKELKECCSKTLPESTGLIERAYHRQVKTGQEAKLSTISKVSKMAQKNILKLLHHVDMTYIYDNSGKDAKLLFSIKNIYDWTPEKGKDKTFIDPGHKVIVTCMVRGNKHIKYLEAGNMDKQLIKMLNKFCK